jgi:hypothetical protein
MPRARRRPTAVPPPAVAKKRYDYEVAEPKDDGKTKPQTAAQKAATKK